MELRKALSMGKALSGIQVFTDDDWEALICWAQERGLTLEIWKDFLGILYRPVLLCYHRGILEEIFSRAPEQVAAYLRFADLPKEARFLRKASSKKEETADPYLDGQNFEG